MSGARPLPDRSIEHDAPPLARSLWEVGEVVVALDQTGLPHRVATVALRTLEDAAHAIASMQVRGAPLIGVTAAYGLALALRDDASDASIARAAEVLVATRPTAVNLRWAVDGARAHVSPLPRHARAEAAWLFARALAEADVAACAKLGEHGLGALARHARDGALTVLTHCNAGWLAAIEHGTALAPIYLAHERGLRVHVVVDETRPRNQGASLTAWELARAGIAHTVVADNAGGLLMARGELDACIVGTDRTARNGDVCNKIGTYLKALAAHDNGVPFYVALPSSTFDVSVARGADIPIEERSADEVRWIAGLDEDGAVRRVRLTPEGSPARNPAFDVTPARLVTAYVTEVGVLAASELEARLSS